MGPANRVKVNLESHICSTKLYPATVVASVGNEVSSFLSASLVAEVQKYHVEKWPHIKTFFIHTRTEVPRHADMPELISLAMQKSLDM